MATADLHAALGHTVPVPEATPRTVAAAPEWLFDAAAMTGSVGGSVGGVVAGAAVGGAAAAGLVTLGVIAGGLVGAAVGRFVVMPVWVGVARLRAGHG